MEELVIIIVNHRTPAITCDCLSTLAVERASIAFDVVVVDNASSDGSAERIEATITEHDWQDWVRVVRSPVNGGFSAGNNLGIQALDADVYLLLNSDTLVRSGAIAELCRAMKQNPNAGLIGPRLECRDGTPQTSCFRYPHPLTELTRAASTGPLTKALRRFTLPLPMSSEATTALEWVSFAAVLIRREVIEQIGLLDDGYFMYFEDIDYCRRANKAGWQILYWPHARVAHLSGSSSPMKSLSQARRRRPAYYYESRARYFSKFYGRAGLWSANSCWLLGRCISLTRELIQRKARIACDNEWYDIWSRAWDPLSGNKPQC